MKWISIKERLPKTEKEVVVFYWQKINGKYYYDIIITHLISISDLSFKTINYRWEFFNDYNVKKREDVGITHWLDIEQPPAEEIIHDPFLEKNQIEKLLNKEESWQDIASE